MHAYFSVGFGILLDFRHFNHFKCILGLEKGEPLQGQLGTVFLD